jgi:hypothetical protein
MTPREKPSDDGRPRPVPRKQAESPQAFYERVTKREDVRRLLRTLANSTRSQPPEWP